VLVVLVVSVLVWLFLLVLSWLGGTKFIGTCTCVHVCVRACV
jgi:hypothetical protein